MLSVTLSQEPTEFIVTGGAPGGHDRVHNRLIRIPGMRRRSRPNSDVGRYAFPPSYPVAAALLTLGDFPVEWRDGAREHAEELGRRLLGRDTALTKHAAVDPECIPWPTERRPYDHQLRALMALRHVRHVQMCTDDMGLGKTLVALWGFWDCANRYPQLWRRHCLVLCQATTKYKWLREVRATLGDSVAPLLIDGTPRQRAKQFVQLRDSNLCIINYDLLRYLNDAQREQLKDFVRGEFAVYDESQMLRNHLSRRSALVAEYEPQFCMELTGTPIENQVDDIYHQLVLLQPQLWRNEHEFENRYCVMRSFAVGKQKKKQRTVVARGKNLDELNQVRACYSFGRKMGEVSGLPEYTETEVPLQLDKASAEFYQRLRDWWLLEFNDTPENEPIFSPRVKTSLEAAARLLQVAQSYIGGVPEPLTPFVAQQNKLWEKIPNRPNELFMPGAVKAQWLIETVEQLWKQDRRVVVFSQFNAPLFWFQQRWGDDARFLHGGLTSKAKDEVVDRFLHGSGKVLLAQLRMAAGWDAYTVQDCIFYGWMWEPSKNRQAIGRLHRNGQKGTVHVLHPVVMGTLEEKVRAAIAAKEGDSDKVMSSWTFADLKEAIERDG